MKADHQIVGMVVAKFAAEVRWQRLFELAAKSLLEWATPLKPDELAKKARAYADALTAQAEESRNLTSEAFVADVERVLEAMGAGTPRDVQ